MTDMDARRATLDLLAARAPEATVCPSEVARAVAAGSDTGSGKAALNWRDAMPMVHAVVDQLVTDGLVQLSWKGKMLATRTGPYRIRRNKRS